MNKFVPVKWKCARSSTSITLVDISELFNVRVFPAFQRGFKNKGES